MACFAFLARRAYNAATPIIDGQTMIYAGQGRGTTAVKFSKDGAKFKATELWSNPDNTVKYNTPVLKNGEIFSLSSQDSLVCINAQDGKTAWANPVEGGRGYASIIDAGSVLMARLGPDGIDAQVQADCVRARCHDL